jgi:hypothetical protein
MEKSKIFLNYVLDDGLERLCFKQVNENVHWIVQDIVKEISDYIWNQSDSDIIHSQFNDFD